jgi:hypothetical protein
MPNMDGIQLPEQIKTSAAGCLRKPFTADQIKEKLVGLISLLASSYSSRCAIWREL